MPLLMDIRALCFLGRAQNWALRRLQFGHYQAPWSTTLVDVWPSLYGTTMQLHRTSIGWSKRGSRFWQQWPSFGPVGWSKKTMAIISIMW